MLKKPTKLTSIRDEVDRGGLSSAESGTWAPPLEPLPVYVNARKNLESRPGTAGSASTLEYDVDLLTGERI